MKRQKNKEKEADLTDQMLESVYNAIAGRLKRAEPGSIEEIQDQVLLGQAWRDLQKHRETKGTRR